MNYDAVAKDILTLAGGPGNVENLTHCFTRLRLELSDRTKADKEKLAQVEGVVSVVERGGQLQVVIGTKVEYVYEADCRRLLPDGTYDIPEHITVAYVPFYKRAAWKVVGFVMQPFRFLI